MLRLHRAKKIAVRIRVGVLARNKEVKVFGWGCEIKRAEARGGGRGGSLSG